MAQPLLGDGVAEQSALAPMGDQIPYRPGEFTRIVRKAADVEIPGSLNTVCFP